MSTQKTFSLSSGAKIPAIGLGTWQSDKGKVQEAVKVALKTGYRHIDCAYVYGNEEEVGQGIKESGVPREEIWITSKLWNSFHKPENVPRGFDATIKALGVGYLDLYLMHWPIAFKTVEAKNGLPEMSPKDGDGKNLIDRELTDDNLSTWRAMEKLVDEGKVKHIGVSNFAQGRLEKLWEQARIKPAANQIELNFNLPQKDYVEWLQKKGVLVQAYSPLGSTGASHRDDPVVKKIAEKHGVDPSNILISWQIHRGVNVLPKSVTPKYIESNFKNVDLSQEDVDELETEANSKPPKRIVDPTEPWQTDIFERGK